MTPFSGAPPEGLWRHLGTAGLGTAGLGAAGLGALHAALADELGRLLALGTSDGPAFQQALGEFALRFFNAAAVPATGLPGASAPALTSMAAAIGPFREHQQRAAGLAAACAALAAAQQAQVALLVPAASAAAAAFGAKLHEFAGAPGGPRQMLDLWIGCADEAWLELVHGEAWCLAQGRALDAAFAVRALQQQIADHAARLAGLPTRTELDDLQRRVRDLERERSGP